MNEDEVRITAFGKTVLIQVGPYLKDKEKLKFELARAVHEFFKEESVALCEEWRKVEEAKEKMFQLALEDKRLWDLVKVEFMKVEEKVK